MTTPCIQVDKLSDLHAKTQITQASLSRMEQDLTEMKSDIKETKNEISGIKQDIGNLNAKITLLSESNNNKYKTREIVMIAVIIGVFMKVADPKLVDVVLSFFK